MKKYICAYIIILAVLLTSCTQTKPVEPTTNPPKTDYNFIEETQPVILDEKPKEITTTYGYDNLSCEKSKKVYELIDKAVYQNNPYYINCEDYIEENLLLETIDAYEGDHPENFWFTGDFYYKVDNNITFIELDYNMKGEELKNAKVVFNKKIEEILNQIPNYENELDRELYIHDYLADNCKYGYDYSLELEEALDATNNAYFALVDGMSACEGLSKAFQLLCNKVGIECICISGITLEEKHMWNIIKINNEWCHVDVTGSVANKETNILKEKYDFFNLSDEYIYDLYNYKPAGYYNEKITPKDSINFYIPKCTSNKNNYYNAKCEKISDFENVDHIINTMANASRNKAEYFYLVVDESMDYETIATQLRKDGHLAKWTEKVNLINENHNQTDYGAVTEIETFNTLIIYLMYK